MALPFVAPRIEQWNKHLSCPSSLYARDVWSLSPIASEAREGKVTEDGLTPVLFGNHMLNFKGNWTKCEGKMAIFTSVPSTPMNFVELRFSHGGVMWPEFFRGTDALWIGSGQEGPRP
jgi:hypothetical protein